MSNALDEAFRSAVAGLRPVKRSGTAATAGIRPGSALSVDATLKLFDAQATSRHLDFAARALQAEGMGFYTIGSAGHESNAAVAAALRPTDPALLHYRSGAFYQARASQVAGSTPARDVLQGLLCAADEPIAGGRHKVFGNAALAVIPQTSTIASHLPRAVGLAVALHRATKLGVSTPWPADAVVVCSFGDASANHSTATGAINTALNTGLPAAAGADPVRLRGQRPGNLGPHAGGLGRVGVRLSTGLTTSRPTGSMSLRPTMPRSQAAEIVRSARRPVFLHLRTVRFLGHAGSDAEISYRSPKELAADYGRDPLLGTATVLVVRRSRDAGRAAGSVRLRGATGRGHRHRARGLSAAERLLPR